MTLISYEDLLATPWKNGGGITRELACYPAGATFDDFLWRVSIADVGLSGPFSSFVGIDRIITLLTGAGMQINFVDGRTHMLTETLVPYRFAGEDRLDAQLVDACCQDFNLMLRRGAVSGDVVVWHDAGTIGDASDFLLLFSARGQWEVTAADGKIITLAPQQTLSTDAVVASVRPVSANSALIGVKIKLQAKNQAEKLN